MSKNTEGARPAHASADPAPYRQSLDGCFASVTGPGGLKRGMYDSWLAKLAPAHDELKAAYRSCALPILRIAEDTADIESAEAAYARLAEGAELIVFFGTGGSGLGGQTLAQLAGWNIPGAASPGQKKRPRTRFYDNLDAGTLGDVLAGLDLASTRFVVTSKSGGTAETLVQAIATLEAVKAAGLEANIPRLFLGLSEPARPGTSNGLRTLFESLDIPLLDHHTGIGGRFSVLTNVGLLPAIARGLDVRLLRAGARTVVDEMMSAPGPAGFAPAQGAAMAVALAKETGIAIQVMMPYADRLARFADWYVQLWAESLGKGGEGTTPIGALGPLDQHSQLQLFMDGPRAHMITILRVDAAAGGPVVDAEMAAKAGIDYMAGRKVADLVAAQSAGVGEALGKAGRPVRSFQLTKLDEYAMGGLMMHFMLETIFAGRLLGVDPFDQPAVELAKRLARERLVGGG